MMFKSLHRATLIFATVIALQTAPLQAMEPGDWLLRVGTHQVNPKSNNSAIVDVDDATQLTFDISYMIDSNWGIEVLAALPFEHDINLKDGTNVGSTEHLPPTVSVQYHFGNGNFQPYVGAGVNYTAFFDESTTGPLAGSDLKLDSSWGFAAQIGFDYLFGEKLFLNAELRHIGIESDASLDGAPLTKVSIDPLAIGVSLGWRF